MGTITTIKLRALQMRNSTHFPFVVAFLVGFVTGNFDRVILPPMMWVASSMASTKVSRSVCTSPMQKSELKPASVFDAAVQAAYEEGILECTPDDGGDRKEFNIRDWNWSGLKSRSGGLRKKDRILLGELYQKATSVFEYGLGESTYMADYLGVPRYAGVDSDAVWVSMVRERVRSDYRFYLADIGTLIKKGYGFPEMQENIGTMDAVSVLGKSALDYQLLPLIVEPLPFDVYLVDGRFRLACLLVSFLHASARGADPSHTQVVVHDCKGGGGPPRKIYDKADHLLELTRHSGFALCVYKRLPTTTDEQLMELWLQYNHFLK